MRHLLSVILLIANLMISPAFANQSTLVDYQRYEKLVQPIVARMNLDEKLGQMTLAKFTFLQSKNQKIDFDLINQYHLGGVLAAGGEVPNGMGGVSSSQDEPKNYMNSTADHWRQLNQQVKAHPVVIGNKTNGAIAIPLLIGVDAVHGHQTVLGEILFPHNIGLSMTHNPNLLTTIGHWTAHRLLDTGFNWTFAPTVAISHNPSWGRTYESLGSMPSLTRQYTAAIVNGLQQPDKGLIHGALATVKHYLGDGATLNGIDEGDVYVTDFARFLHVNSAGYHGALDSSAGSIMISYSAVNGLPMSINDTLVRQYLRQGKYFGKPFSGLIVSDYGAIDKVAHQGLPTTKEHYSYQTALTKAINSGIDMVMISSTTNDESLPTFLNTLKQQVETGAIPLQRIDDAVTHILAVKYAMGLIQLDSDQHWQHDVRPPLPEFTKTSQTELNVAISAAEQSLVLLKNSQKTLPLNSKKIKYIVLVGESLLSVRQDDGSYRGKLFPHYNNIGAQCGGWTTSWQGIEGNDFWQGKNKKTAGAISLLEGLKSIAPHITWVYPHYRPTTSIEDTRQKFLQDLKTRYTDMNAKNTVIIGTLAELPYAEFMGDVASPYCQDNKNYQQGCLYNQHLNPYLPLQQPRSLAINYDTFTQKIIQTVQAKANDIPLITILLSGRPMIIQQPLQQSAAFVAAWLPGTAGGQAIANALFGHYLFCAGKHAPDSSSCVLNSPNTLTLPWVRNMAQLRDYPRYTAGSGFVSYADPLFPIGYGLATEKLTDG